MNPNPFSLAGRKGLILGIANDSSIAFGCARLARRMGAEVVASCQGDKARGFVEPHTRPLGIELIDCDVQTPGALESAVSHAARRLGTLDFVIHSIAWAPLADLHGDVIDSSREGFARAMDISCHSFTRMAHLAEPLMTEGGSLMTMSYVGAEEVVPNYGVMGPVKAALESTTRYLAAELGPKGIRVNAISPGPLATRAASGIPNFDALMDDAARRAPLRRLVELHEVGALCSFLASDQAKAITGYTLYIDSGYHILR